MFRAMKRDYTDAEFEVVGEPKRNEVIERAARLRWPHPDAPDPLPLWFKALMMLAAVVFLAALPLYKWDVARHPSDHPEAVGSADPRPSAPR